MMVMLVAFRTEEVAWINFKASLELVHTRWVGATLAVFSNAAPIPMLSVHSTALSFHVPQKKSIACGTFFRTVGCIANRCMATKLQWIELYRNITCDISVQFCEKHKHKFDELGLEHQHSVLPEHSCVINVARQCEGALKNTEKRSS